MPIPYHSFPILNTRLAYSWSCPFPLTDHLCPITGSIRTATKRAGGSVRNNGGSPGKRLGVKKFSGAWSSPSTSYPSPHSSNRPIRHSWEHHRAATRDAVSPWSARKLRPALPFISRYQSRWVWPFGSRSKLVVIIHCMLLYRGTSVSTSRSGCGGNVNSLALSSIEERSYLAMNKPSVAVVSLGL